MDVRIVGVDLPGRTWGDPRAGGCVYAAIHVGVQRGKEVVELFPADVDAATWDLVVDAVHGDGAVDFRGPDVHGRRGDRFLYLSWGTVGEGGGFEMFRRAKLMLGSVDPGVVRAADCAGHRLVGSLRLTGGDGGPRCAAVRPPAIEWAAGASTTRGG